MRCEIIHVLGIAEAEADKMLQYFPMQTSWSQLGNASLRQIEKASDRDYLVFNAGHHVGKKLGGGWETKYPKVLEEAFGLDFGSIPDKQIFFRTTTVRHFLRGKGDWNTNTSQAGGSRPNITDVWHAYGGDSSELPQQNLMAFKVFLQYDGNNKNSTKNVLPERKFSILDTSPMMLARSDASFDGSHFCLPGPMEFWSRMLYYRIERHSGE